MYILLFNHVKITSYNWHFLKKVCDFYNEGRCEIEMYKNDQFEIVITL